MLKLMVVTLASAGFTYVVALPLNQFRSPLVVMALLLLGFVYLTSTLAHQDFDRETEGGHSLFYGYVGPVGFGVFGASLALNARLSSEAAEWVTIPLLLLTAILGLTAIVVWTSAVHSRESRWKLSLQIGSRDTLTTLASMRLLRFHARADRYISALLGDKIEELERQLRNFPPKGEK